MEKNIYGIRINDDVDWKNMDYKALATIIAVMVGFLVTVYLTVLL